jgi:undecaprenyl-diphosphatase
LDLIHQLDLLDKDLLIWLNSFNSPFWDQFMIMVTGKLIWVPLYVAIAVLIYFKHPRTWWLIILAITSTIVCADLFASALLKPSIGRLRPCHTEYLKHILNIPGGCGGKYGFISSHSSNTFGLATFLFLLFRKRFAWIALIFVWASVVSYSRIHLGVHYPGDIAAGMIAGSLWACFFFWLYQALKVRYFTKAD